jgi:sec-independent protein translocase protein TatA
MPNLGPTELIIILVIILAIFGAGKLAGLGGALGKGVKDFRTSMKEESDADDEGKVEEKPISEASKASVDAQTVKDDSPAETETTKEA